jgi:hypothetical protein
LRRFLIVAALLSVASTAAMAASGNGLPFHSMTLGVAEPAAQKEATRAKESIVLTAVGTLHRSPNFGFTGEAGATTFSVTSQDHTFALDFSRAPQLSSAAAANVSKSVQVTGKLVKKSSMTITGKSVEYSVLEVSELSPAK